jgi:mRNA-degrading endonuclease RelE of RelBE toxin-antitoxin system
MSYKIYSTRQFSIDFKKLRDKKTRATIKKKIEDVSEDPTRYKRLHYALKGSFRIRIGPYRIIYSIDDSKKEMYLEKLVFDHKYRQKG